MSIISMGVFGNVVPVVKKLLLGAFLLKLEMYQSLHVLEIEVPLCSCECCICLSVLKEITNCFTLAATVNGVLWLILSSQNFFSG